MIEGKGLLKFSNVHLDETQHEDAICRVTKEGLSKGPILDPPFDGLTCQEAPNPFSSSRGFERTNLLQPFYVVS